jgi:hypothetical protein
MGDKWLLAVVQSFNPQTNTYCLSLVTQAWTHQGQVPQAAADKVRAAFIPGEKVEYYSVTKGNKWLSAVIQSFSSTTDTYCLNLMPQGQVPQAAPEKIRAARGVAPQVQAFMPGDKVEYCSATMGCKWVPGVVQSFNPQTNTYRLNLIPQGHARQAAAEKVRAARDQGQSAVVPVTNVPQMQAFMIGEMVEYCSATMGGQWVPGVVQSFNSQTNTYCLNLIPFGQVPLAAPQKIRGHRLLAVDEAVSTQGWKELEDFEVWPEEKKIPRTRKSQSRVSFADEKGLELEEVHCVEEVKKSAEASFAHCIGGTHWIIIDQVRQQPSVAMTSPRLPASPRLPCIPVSPRPGVPILVA